MAGGARWRCACARPRWRGWSRMARADAATADVVKPLLLLGLGDPAQPVRKLAFDSLAALGMSAAELGAEALAVGQRDVGVLGLALLAADKGDAKARRKVLEQVLLGGTDGLEEEAGKLLAESAGWEAVHVAGLEARSPGLRAQSVAGPRAALRGERGRAQGAAGRAGVALPRGPREGRAGAGRQEGRGRLRRAGGHAPRTDAQKQAIDALGQLGDPRTPDALLDRLDDRSRRRRAGGRALQGGRGVPAAGIRRPAAPPPRRQEAPPRGLRGASKRERVRLGRRRPRARAASPTPPRAPAPRSTSSPASSTRRTGSATPSSSPGW